MIYGYARVSTKGQAKDGNSLQVQETELQKSGAQIVLRESFTGFIGRKGCAGGLFSLG